ncbi:MAG: methyltransferase [Asticcacaulis sp.]|nr:methyltransferase [Asticcacaulis sp.]
MQPARGYRIGMDGALLAAACAAIVTQRKAVHITGIERETSYAAMARDNVALNGFDGVEVVEGDIGAGFRSFGLERFDLAFSNPPYFDDPDALRPPHDAKRAAWIADDGLGTWLEFALAAVTDGGEIVFIHRADRLADLLGGLSAKAGSFMVRPIQPFTDRCAKRVLVRAQRLGKAPLRLLPPLVLHDGGVRKHTDGVEAILHGEAMLEW